MNQNNISFEEVIKGLECCQECDGRVCRNRCPYHDRNEPEDQATCTCHLAHDAAALLKEYDEALKLMVYQYCTMAPLTISDEIFHNQYTSAGEAAFRLLGLKNGQSTDCVWERWFPNA